MDYNVLFGVFIGFGKMLVVEFVIFCIFNVYFGIKVCIKVIKFYMYF